MSKSNTNKTTFAFIMILAVVVVLIAAYYTFNHNKALVEKQQSIETEQNFSVFDPVLPGNPIELPRDFGMHLGFHTESSTFFASLTDENGKEYWASWDVYRTALDENLGIGWQQPHVFVSNAALSDTSEQFFEQRIARGGIGLVGIEQRPFRFWIDNWEWRGLTSHPLPGSLKVSADNFDLDLKIYANGPYVIEGDEGYRPKHDLLPVASYQFAAPFLKVGGHISIEGESIPVSGTGWLAREWGSNLLESKLNGFDRFGLDLEDGRRLLVYLSHINKQLPYAFASIANKTGDVVEIDDNDIVVRPVRYVFMSTGQRVPVQWTITIPNESIRVVVTAKYSDQWLPSLIPYWIGAVEVVGSHRGSGFMQLMGY